MNLRLPAFYLAWYPPASSKLTDSGELSGQKRYRKGFTAVLPRKRQFPNDIDLPIAADTPSLRQLLQHRLRQSWRAQPISAAQLPALHSPLALFADKYQKHRSLTNFISVQTSRSPSCCPSSRALVSRLHDMVDWFIPTAASAVASRCTQNHG